MFRPLIHACEVTNADGLLNLDVRNLKNPKSKVSIFRLLEIQLLNKSTDFDKLRRFLRHEFSNKDKNHDNNHDGDDDDDEYCNNYIDDVTGSYILAECAYEIIVKEQPSLGTFQEQQQQQQQQQQHQHQCNQFIKIEMSGFGNLKVINIPRKGVCVISGRLPVIAPYVTYSAICEIQPAYLNNVKYLNGEHVALDGLSFKIMQIMDFSVRKKLRNMDIMYILERELSLSHLKDSFVNECHYNKNNNNNNQVKKNCGKKEIFQPHPLLIDEWDPNNLNPGGNNHNIYKDYIPKSKWYKLCKFFKLVTAFPNLVSLILNSFTESQLEKANKVICDTKRAWKFVLFPLTLVKFSPNAFHKLITDNYGNTYDPKKNDFDSFISWAHFVKELPINNRIIYYLSAKRKNLIIPLALQQQIEFYEKEVKGSLESSGSTYVILSQSSITKQMRMPNYSKIFGVLEDNMTEKYHTLFRLLTDFCLIRRFDEYSLAEMFKNLIAKQEGYFPGKYIDVNLCNTIEEIPMDSYVLNSSWRNCENITERILELWILAQKEIMHEIKIKLNQPFQTKEYITREKDDRKSTHTKLITRINANGQYKFMKRGNNQEEIEVTLTPDQTSILIASVLCPLVVVAGAPGAGKTLVIEALFDLFTDENGNDINKVAVVTQGGCMAKELEKRGMLKAKTIHSALRDRYSFFRKKKSLPCNDNSIDVSNDNHDIFDYDSVQILIIDEFSNVTDELAASIYSKECFPNLRTIVHVFDPLQTGPIGLGSLATDYIQTLPKIDFVNDTILDHMLSNILNLVKKGSLEKADSYRLVKDLMLIKNGQDKRNIFQHQDLLFKYLSSLTSRAKGESLDDGDELKTIVSILTPLGMCIHLKKRHRFGEESLIAKNDDILVRGCKESFIFDEETFIQRSCYALPSDSELKLLNFDKCISKESVMKTIGDVESMLSSTSIGNYLMKKMKDHVDNSGESDFQLLGLTNDVCKTLNRICDFLHTYYFCLSKMKKNPNNEDNDNNMIQEICYNDECEEEEEEEKEKEEEEEEVSILPSLCRGSRILFRENKSTIVIKNDAPFGSTFGGCVDDMRLLITRTIVKLNIPEIMKPRVTDYCRGMNDTSTSNGKGGGGGGGGGDDDNEDFNDDFLEIDIFNNLAKEMRDYSEDYYNVMIENLSYPKIIMSPTVQNGTIITLYGVADFLTKPLEPDDLYQYIWSKQSRIVLKMEYLLNGCAGKGSKLKKKMIRRAFIRKFQKLYTLEYICKCIHKLNSPRWCDPYKENNTLRSSLTKDLESIISDRLILSKKELQRNCERGPGWQRYLIDTKGFFYPLGRKYINISLLQPAWAITVNFSQGKEYNECSLVIPEKSSQMKDIQQSKSLLHTTFANFDRTHIHVALTRPKKNFIYFGEKDTLRIIAMRNNETLSNRLTVMSTILKILVDWADLQSKKFYSNDY